MIFFCPEAIQAQTTACPNANFSLRNFDNWNGAYGTFEYPGLQKGYRPERQSIVTSGYYDHNTCDLLYILPPGEDVCAKLGNDDVGAEAEQLSYTMQVTDESSLFVYKYAIVMEDPGHTPDHQPSFTIQVKDASGSLVDPVCGYYYVYAQPNLPSWQQCDMVIWKDWTTVGIDLQAYIGKAITIEFTTRDCQEGGHFGYAYLSAACGSSKIQYSFCPGSTLGKATAPAGLSYLWSNGATTQSIDIINPTQGTTDFCTLTAANGCQVTISGTFNATLVQSAFSYDTVCLGQPTHFIDESSINQHEIKTWKWDFGDSIVDNTNARNPVHAYARPGTYQVSLEVASDDGCPDKISQQVTVVPVPQKGFSITNPCYDIPGPDTAYYHLNTILSAPLGSDSYLWNTGDITSSLYVDTEGFFMVTMQNQNLCSVSDTFYLGQCYPIFFPSAFTPDGDNLNDTFGAVRLANHLARYSLKVYNSMGQEVFYTDQVSQSWDGKFHHENCPAGMYAFKVVYEIELGKPLEETGSVMLLR